MTSVPAVPSRLLGSIAVVLLLVVAGTGQQPTKVSTAAVVQPPAAELKQCAAREFGPSFELQDAPPLLLDIDGDGTEDAVLVATSKNPLLDSEELHYKVVDPYDDFFGWGDPKVTVGFAPSNTGSPRFLLVLHDWRAATPKAKFVIINLPFDKLSVGRTMRKKKPVAAISAEEGSGLNSFVYWDGKKYRWQPNYVNP